MASTTPTFLCSSTQTKSALFTISLSLTPKPPKLRSYTSVPQLGIRLSSQWSGLRHMSVSIRHKIVKFERKGRCRGGKGVVFASLFGVGAPEALVIGVVALLVFGPKGLAEVARNLGKTLRAFQPTIRELQDVSREFKSTLEREIGLDENPPSMQSTYKSPTADTSTTTTTNTSPSSDVNNENSQAVIDPSK
ncbi:hypothetical protein GIB67_037285 [Kingdonia uniflora]|uniref:Uncharacterized protein n=1 Tax=Kingdonia uniflora TaxID=39325 RepID=A0A7J7MSD6_9MAGN|nr:hypothetical protein GIB67_037285 [Kingdonia uniflora]